MFLKNNYVTVFDPEKVLQWSMLMHNALVFLCLEDTFSLDLSTTSRFIIFLPLILLNKSLILREENENSTSNRGEMCKIYKDLKNLDKNPNDPIKNGKQI